MEHIRDGADHLPAPALIHWHRAKYLCVCCTGTYSKQLPTLEISTWILRYAHTYTVHTQYIHDTSTFTRIQASYRVREVDKAKRDHKERDLLLLSFQGKFRLHLPHVPKAVPVPGGGCRGMGQFCATSLIHKISQNCW